MSFRTLRARLLGVQSVLVVGLTLATLVVVSVLADRAVRQRVAADLVRSRDAIVAADATRDGELRLVAELVASFPELRALFATDAATIRDFLSSYRQTHGRAELLVALDARGQVVARSDTFAPLVIAQVESRWVQPALSGRPTAGYLEIDGTTHRGVIAAAEAGGTVFGFVVAAAPVDDGWAGLLARSSEKEVVVLSETGVLGSTLPRTQVPWQSTRDLPQVSDGPFESVVNNERLQAIAVASSADTSVRLVSIESLDRALAPYRSIQFGLILMGVIAAAAGIAGSALFARSLTKPIGQLVSATEAVAKGQFDVSLPVSRRDELGTLAGSFNTMVAGLRERADMQKFVSHSTVEMIQQARTEERRAGERRTMTVLFSDIRGFTAFSEHRPPEESVAVLNEYLRLQADLVERFHGDVDKFMGDAVFAQFTGPDMALDAIRCAVEIQRAVAAASSRPGGASLAVGIGVATGDVIVGSIGSDARLDHTAIGAPVNLGSRLCSAADPHEILLSEATYALVRDLVAAEALPPIPIKGVSDAVQVYRMRLKA